MEILVLIIVVLTGIGFVLANQKHNTEYNSNKEKKGRE